MKVHPVARLFPRMSRVQFEDLVASIEKQGQLEPVLLADGKVADGRQLKIECHTVNWEEVRPSADASLVDCVLARNLHRRHMSKSQRSAIATETLPLYEAEAQQRMREAGANGAKGGRPRKDSKKKTPGTKVTQGFGVADASSADRVSGGKRAPTSVQRAARQANVSPTYVKAAKRIEAIAPEMMPLLKSGALKIPTAKRLLSLDKLVRRSVLRRGESVGYKKALQEYERRDAGSPEVKWKQVDSLVCRASDLLAKATGLVDELSAEQHAALWTRAEKAVDTLDRLFASCSDEYLLLVARGDDLVGYTSSVVMIDYEASAAGLREMLHHLRESNAADE